MGCWCNYNSKLYLVLLCLHVYDWFDLKTLISSHLWCSVWIVFAVHWEMPLLDRLRMATVLLINSWGKHICPLSLYTIRKNEFEVSLWARTPIFSELIQVSTEWSDKEYAYSPYNGMPSYHKGHCKCYPGLPRLLHPSPYLFEVSKKVLWHPFKHLGGGRHLGDLSPELFCNICIE